MMAADKAQLSNFSLAPLILIAHAQHSLPTGSEIVDENARHGTGLGIKGVPAPKPKPAEDVPGVPTAAWARVKRGVPASDPFKPGVGFMLMVDGARFLPGTAYAYTRLTIVSLNSFLSTTVACTFWSKDLIHEASQLCYVPATLVP